MKTKLIICDLDDCLVDTYGALVPTCIKQAIKAMMDVGLQVESFETAVNKLTEINNSSRNGTEALQTFLIQQGANPTLLESGKKGFYDFDFDYQINTLPGVNEMFKQTKADFALVTKGEYQPQIDKLKKAGIDKNIFKKIMVVSNYNKKEYYQQIMDQLEYTASDCFVCGDRYKTDLLPAKELGIKTIYVHWGRGKIHPPALDEVDFVITDFRKLIHLVNNLVDTSKKK